MERSSDPLRVVCSFLRVPSSKGFEYAVPFAVSTWNGIRVRFFDVCHYRVRDSAPDGSSP